jgi:hypothetical protein
MQQVESNQIRVPVVSASNDTVLRSARTVALPQLHDMCVNMWFAESGKHYIYAVTATES